MSTISYIATYQTNYRSSPVTCIVTLPEEGLTPEEKLEAVQLQCQNHAWDKVRGDHQYYYTNYEKQAILALIKV